MIFARLGNACMPYELVEDKNLEQGQQSPIVHTYVLSPYIPSTIEDLVFSLGALDLHCYWKHLNWSLLEYFPYLNRSLRESCYNDKWKFNFDRPNEVICQKKGFLKCLPDQTTTLARSILQIAEKSCNLQCLRY